MRNHFLPRYKALVAVFTLLISPSFLLAQGETFTDCDEWSNAVCGEIVDAGFDTFLDSQGNSIPMGVAAFVPSPQTVSYGTISNPGNTPDVINAFNAEFANGSSGAGAFFDEPRPLVFTIDSSDEPLEGVCFSYFLTNVATPDGDVGDFVFNAYDGDDLVVSIATPAESFATIDDVDAADFPMFGWRNTDGLNITRFEFGIANSPEPDSIGGGVFNGELSFGEVCDPPVETCFDQLGAVKADAEAFAATLEGHDRYIAECTVELLCWMRDDIFWEQPSGNRLSRYGGSMFIGAAYAISYLEWIDDPQADVLIDDLILVLECIVDSEIEYAIANDGHQCFIDRAEDFAELGEIIDDDFENEVIAALAYRLAWLNAYYATY